MRSTVWTSSIDTPCGHTAVDQLSEPVIEFAFGKASNVMKVLLVDDDAFLRDMYATKFKEAGHSIETAESARDGLAILKSTQVDVVLLDMVMPGMDGVEFMEAAAKEEGISETTFIVLSNQGEESDKQRAEEAGAVGYIVKAESIPSDVVAKVESIVK